MDITCRRVNFVGVVDTFYQMPVFKVPVRHAFVVVPHSEKIAVPAELTTERYGAQ